MTLDKILREHQKWLSGDGGKRADLRGVDLRCADLRGTDLRGADIRGADLRGAYLRYTDLKGADIQKEESGRDTRELENHEGADEDAPTT